MAAGCGFPKREPPDHSYPATQLSCTAALTTTHAKSW
jgi:hypothetical protein